MSGLDSSDPNDPPNSRRFADQGRSKFSISPLSAPFPSKSDPRGSSHFRNLLYLKNKRHKIGFVRSRRSQTRRRNFLVLFASSGRFRSNPRSVDSENFLDENPGSHRPPLWIRLPTSHCEFEVCIFSRLRSAQAVYRSIPPLKTNLLRLTRNRFQGGRTRRFFEDRHSRRFEKLR